MSDDVSVRRTKLLVAVLLLPQVLIEFRWAWLRINWSSWPSSLLFNRLYADAITVFAAVGLIAGLVYLVKPVGTGLPRQRIPNPQIGWHVNTALWIALIGGFGVAAFFGYLILREVI